MNNTNQMGKKQSGSAMFEFALTLPLFLVMVFAIFEATLLMMDMARANEVTRELARIAIVRSPVCDLLNDGCPGAVAGLSCPGGAPVSVTLEGLASGCASGTDSTACVMFNSAKRLITEITPDQIEVTYACSTVGAATRPNAIPLVSVSLRNFSHDTLFSPLLGIAARVDFPAFETTRTGEDLYTERLP